MLCNEFNLVVSSPSDRRGSEARICIIATKDKTAGFDHIDCSYYVSIMSSCYKHYSVCYKLNTLSCMLDSGQGVE